MQSSAVQCSAVQFNSVQCNAVQFYAVLCCGVKGDCPPDLHSTAAVQPLEEAQNTAARYTTLHCTALHCSALHCTALHCIALFTALFTELCTELQISSVLAPKCGSGLEQDHSCSDSRRLATRIGETGRMADWD